MPWKSSDAVHHSRKADTPHKASKWAETANRTLKATGDEARAIREANYVVSNMTNAPAKKTGGHWSGK
jgi:hypothetical protein